MDMAAVSNRFRALLLTRRSRFGALTAWTVSAGALAALLLWLFLPNGGTTAKPPAGTQSVLSSKSEGTTLSALHSRQSNEGDTGVSASQLLASGQLQRGGAETRLVEIFALIENGDIKGALQKAEQLTRDYPHFHLAHLVKGDLLKLRYEPQAPTDPSGIAQTEGASARLAALRTETQARLTALRDRPLPDHVPHQFLALSSQTRHAIAVDASRSRLYLFENVVVADSSGDAHPPLLKLVGDFFISVGKSGINKRVEGDGKTPLGAYYITSVRDRKSLPEFYGSGALPLNYPNALDVQRGRTGSGIWLHGSPPQQYVRAPLASDGCVVLSNPDMDRLLALVAPRTTPVVIAEQLQWVPREVLQKDTAAFSSVIMAWQHARSQATPEAFAQLFDRTALTKVGLAHKDGGADLLVNPAAQLGVANLSLLKWQDPNDNLIATFDETLNGRPTGVVRRQYWAQHAEGWRLLQDTVLAGTPSPALKRTLARPTDDARNPTAQDTSTAAAVAKATQPPPRTPGTANGTQTQQQVQLAVQAWAKAWSQKNMTNYLAAYAPSFDPPGGLSRKAWEQERKDRILSKSKITVALSKISTQVNGSTATVTFLQNYKADQLAVSSRKTLKMVKRGDQWLITHESVGR